jgi:hypothetical protein
MLQLLLRRGFRGEAVEFAEGFRFAVLDEFIRPAAAFDRGSGGGDLGIADLRIR